MVRWSLQCCHIFMFSFLVFEKITVSLRSWGWMNSSEMWWWFRICNKKHSLSFAFSILFSIGIHHLHQASPFCHFRPCGWSIGARLTNLSWDFTIMTVWGSRRRYQAVTSRGEDLASMWTRRSPDPFAQRFASCLLFVHAAHTKRKITSLSLAIHTNSHAIHSCI